MIKCLSGIFSLIVAFMLLTVSCKNTSGSSSSSSSSEESSKPGPDQLLGKWKLHKVLDEKDTTGAAPQICDSRNIYVVFKKDGTGGYADPEGNNPFTWIYANSNTYVNITDSASQKLTSLLVISLAAKEFTVKDTNANSSLKETFVRQ